MRKRGEKATRILTSYSKEGMLVKSKRSQVTIFIIIAILIVAVVAGFFYLRQRAPSIDNNLPPEASDFKLYMDDCLKNVLESDLVYLGNQGGYSNKETLSVYYSGFNIPYYFYEDKRTLTSLDSISGSLEELVKNDFNDICYGLYNDSSISITKKNAPILNIVTSSDKVSIDVNMPITIEKGNSTSIVSEYSAEVPIRLQRVYETAEKIVSLQEEDKYHICLSCIDSIRDPSMLITSYTWENSTLVFMISDYGSDVDGEPYKFFFAIKYKDYDCKSLPSDIDDYIKEECKNETEVLNG